ncbi:MAG: leucine-rich repeat protein, partial [Bacteroidales bacterium]|nr:leucine-rich repeat protein [Bacteroidales bacterium]
MKKTFLILAAMLCCCFALKAQDFYCDGLKYSVLYDYLPAVKLVRCPPDFQAHDFVIPSTINHEGRTYIVRQIGEGAFENCGKLTGSLTIPNSVASIGNSAFAGCGALDGSLTIGNSVFRIGDYAFSHCGFGGTLIIGEFVGQIDYKAFEHTHFTQIISRCPSPPRLRSDAFPENFFLNEPVVPCGSGSDYKKASGWSQFRIIREDFVQFELTVTSANPDFGSASIDQTATCQNNGQVTVSATPAGNCMFTCWTENGEVVSTDNPYTFTLESDCNLVANFWEKKYIYEPIESLPSHISSNDIYVLGYQDGNNYYLHSSGTAAGEMKLSLYPANPVEYRFADFESSNLVFASCNINNNNKSLSITTQGVSLSPFNPFGGSTDPFALSITDGNISSAGSSGYTVCHNGNIITAHTGPSEGNLRFFKRIPLHYITLSVSPEETGTATATSGGETVQSAVEGTEITVSATPTEGYRFKNWTENGEVASTENPYTFTLTADRNLVANFYKPYDFSAICETGQTLYYRIIDAEQHWVSIVAPNSDNYLECYEGYTIPAGNISLPATVSHNEISYTVKAIGDCAFYSCSGLTGLLTIPNSVTNIGEGAFERCSGFTGSLTIPNSVTNIGETAFWYCSGFNGSLTIGSSVTN